VLTFVEAADDLPGDLSSEGIQMLKFENEHFKQPQLTFKQLAWSKNVIHHNSVLKSEVSR
jgi:hypothetical protein